jgi:hypothetical protein
MIRGIMRLLACCALAGCGLLAAEPARARTQVLKTQAGSVVHWDAADITIGVDWTNGSPNLDRLDVLMAVERAARVWNRIPADQPRFRLIGGGTPDVRVRFCRGSWQGDTIDLGRTHFDARPEDGRVSAATVELNTCDHGFTVADERAPERYDLEAVLSHELGHVLGLGHADDGAAVMYPSGQGAATRIPTDDDEAALAVIYLGRGGASIAPPSAPPPSPQAVTPAPAAAATAKVPTDSVSQLDVKGGDGRALTLFTCEPTLLPPMTDTSERVAHPRNPAASVAKPRGAPR